MTDDTRKVQLGSQMDTTGATKGLQEIAQGAREMARDVTAAGTQAAAGIDKVGKGSAESAAKMDRATANIISSVQRATAALKAGEKGSADFFEALGAQRGVNMEALRPYIQQLREVESQQQRVGVSAGQTTQALRQLPAQFTDIFTSLASGQQPVTVFIQQFGQIKDSFGGVGNAARAMGGYVVGLVNPLTLTATAMLGLAAAAYMGNAESRAFERQLVQSGNAAGVTAGQFGVLAREVSALAGGTVGNAAQALVAMANAGISTEDSLRRITAGAVALARAGGPAVQTTAEEFAKLADAPLEASLKLNEAQNYLTAGTYARIKSLQEEGRAVEAARVAQEAYLDAITGRTPKLESNLGSLERAWRFVKEGAAKAWDSMLDVGRDNNAVEQKIANLKKAMGTNQKWIDAGILGKDFNDGLRRQLEALEAQEASAKAAAEADAQRAKQVKLLADYQKDSSRYLTNAEQAQRDLNKAVTEGVAAGASLDEILRRVAYIRQQADPQTYLDDIATAENRRNESIKRGLVEVQQLRQTGVLNEYQEIQATAALEQRTFASRRSALQEQLAIARSRIDSEREVSQLVAQIDAVDQASKTARAQAEAQLAIAIDQRRDAAIKAYYLDVEQNKGEIDAYQRAQYDSRIKLERAALDSAEAIRDESEALRIEASLVGASDVVRQRALATYRAELDLKKKLREIDEADLPGGEAEREEKRAEARLQAARKLANAEQRIELDVYRKTTEEYTNLLTDALMRGFEAGKDGARSLRDAVVNMFKTMILRPVLQLVISPIAAGISGGISSLLGPGVAQAAGAAGGGGGVLSALGALGGLSSLASIFKMGAQMTGWTGAGTGVALEGAGAMIGNGSILQGLAQGLGALAPWAGGAAAGIYGGRAISGGYSAMGGSSGNAAVNVGTSIGAVIAGPIGAAVGGALGGLFNRAFGTKMEYVDSGIDGSISAGDASGRNYQDWVRKGGWFRSTKRGTNYSAMSQEQGQVLDQGAQAVYGQVKAWAEALALPAEELARVTTTFRIKLTDNAQENEKLLADLFSRYQEELAGRFQSALQPYQKAGEQLSATFARLAVLETFSKGINDLGGIFSVVARASVGAREALLDLVGGMENFNTMAQGYIGNYYSRDEIAGGKAKQLQTALAGVGITNDFSAEDARGQFRALVESSNVNTEAGRKRLATLLGLQGDFANVADYMSETGKTLGQVATSAPESAVLAPLLASGTSQQVAATNEVRDAVLTMNRSLEAVMANAVRSTAGGSGWREVVLAR